MSRNNKPKVILFNHLAKTGGSTLSFILKTGFQAQRVDANALHTLDPADESPIICIIEDYLDWVRLKDTSAQTARRNMILEGHTWGAERLLSGPRDFIRVTMIRDPFRTFLSNYSFSIKENTEYPLPVERYYEDRYGKNSFTRFFGDGDLETAKCNLETSYDFFGLVEKYRETAAMAARYFDYPLEPYIVQNKSDSEKTPLPESFIARFRADNDDDFRLYDFMANLFDRRYAALVGEVSLEADRLETISPTESYRHSVRDNHDRLLECIAQDRHAEAVELLEDNLRRSEAGEIYYHLGEVLALGRCYAKLNKFEKAKDVYLSTLDKRPAHAMNDVIRFLKGYDPKLALDILASAQTTIEGMIYDHPVNSYSIEEYVRLSVMKTGVFGEMNLHAAAALSSEKALQTLNRRIGVEAETSVRAVEYVRLLRQTQQYYGRLQFAAPREDLFERYGKDKVIGRLEIEARGEAEIRQSSPSLVSFIEAEAIYGGPVSSWYFSLLVGLLRSCGESASLDMALSERVLERLMYLMRVPPPERKIATMFQRKGLSGQVAEVLAPYHFDPIAG